MKDELIRNIVSGLDRDSLEELAGDGLRLLEEGFDHLCLLIYRAVKDNSVRVEVEQGRDADELDNLEAIRGLAALQYSDSYNYYRTQMKKYGAWNEEYDKWFSDAKIGIYTEH
jgi:hypothetical protein